MLKAEEWMDIGLLHREGHSIKVECETQDSLFSIPVKIEGFWQRPMGAQTCKCDKYCSSQVFGVPQTYLGQNLFTPVGGVYCSNFDPNGI